MGLIIELCAGSCSEEVLFPTTVPLPALHDMVEAHALARTVAAAPMELIHYARAEATALLEQHSDILTALRDGLIEHGELSGEQVDQVIVDTITWRNAKAERERRQNWARREAGARMFEAFREGENSMLQNLSAPGIAGDPTVIGNTLSIVGGAWAGGSRTSVTYQWLSDNVPIPGATAATYTLQASDAGHLINCAMTFGDGTGWQITLKAHEVLAGSLPVDSPIADQPASQP